MKGAIVFLILSLPFFGYTQTKGIKWTDNLTWGQILAKAKSENKYVFLDCYATWCVPCHAMDKDVYPNDEVGNIINRKFIAVKVQMDQTQYDNERVKQWHNDARRIQNNYTVMSFPTFLFFYPNGAPMHRGVGYRSSNEFITLIKEALDTNKQYYALLKNYQPGKFDTSELKGLARALKSSGEELAVKMAIEYLSAIPKSQLKNEDNINLMCDFKGSPQMQRFVSKHLSTVPTKYYSAPANMTLIRNFSSLDAVKRLILNYAQQLSTSSIIRNLALLSIFKNEAQAKKIADKFIHNLVTDKIFTKELLFFVADFTNTSSDKGFKLFYKAPQRIDEVVQVNGYSNAKVMNILIEEEYSKFYQDAIKDSTDNIPWRQIFEKVKQKYNAIIAERLEVYVKSSLYEYFAKERNKYWSEYISFYIQKVEKYGTDTTGPQHQFFDAFLLNNFVFEAIFYHSNDTNQMKIGLKWMEGVIRRNPRQANNIDTYANLLYKAGNIKDAIQWQEKAVEIAIQDKEEWMLPSLQGNLAKMKKGEPTWITQVVN